MVAMLWDALGLSSWLMSLMSKDSRQELLLRLQFLIDELLVLRLYFVGLSSVRVRLLRLQTHVLVLILRFKLRVRYLVIRCRSVS